MKTTIKTAFIGLLAFCVGLLLRFIFVEIVENPGWTDSSDITQTLLAAGYICTFLFWIILKINNADGEND